ncbi:helix-turn-helix transcriptional regulator [Actinosynnema sp. NPDC023794]
MTVGELIREQRAARRMSQTELVELAGLDSKSRLSRIESGTGTYTPTPQELGRIASAIGTSVELFYAAAKFPLPYAGFYDKPSEFMKAEFGIEPTRENLEEIGKRVCASYRKWLDTLGDYTQEGIEREAKVFDRVQSAWPMTHSETILYEWFRLLDELGLR